MYEISKDNKTIKFVKDNKEIAKHLPLNDTVMSVKFIDNGRKMLYKDNGWYFIREVDREFGDGIGDVCPICNQGIVEDMGGCHTCMNCSTMLKCGL